LRARGALRLIALFKLCKVTLLVAVGLGAFGLMQPKVAERAHAWATSLAMSYHSPLVHRAVALTSGLTPRRLEVLGIAAFLFAGLFATEGLGLWLGKRWAEYLTVIATLSLVPLEVFELLRHASLARFSALVLNLAVAAYLIYLLRRRR
jgi:uncharacterized membrane protein (DUF2068 family)